MADQSGGGQGELSPDAFDSLKETSWRSGMLGARTCGDKAGNSDE
jgi:hypothetical protein